MMMTMYSYIQLELVLFISMFHTYAVVYGKKKIVFTCRYVRRGWGCLCPPPPPLPSFKGQPSQLQAVPLHD